jgi:hypothetical protein
MNTLHAAVPAISCLLLPKAQYFSRLDAAEEREENLQVRYNRETGRYGLEIMWHPTFSAEYVAVMSKMPLHEISTWQEGLAGWANGEQELDLIDYCYLADVLREGLADNPTPLAALRLERALTWIEQAGTKLLATQSTLLAPASEVAAHHMAAA